MHLGLASSEILLLSLISAAFIGAAISRGEVLSKGRSQFQCGYQRVWHLFVALQLV